MGILSKWNLLATCATFLIITSFGLINNNNLVQAQDNALWNDYLKCRDTLGKISWLCDPNNKIYKQTAEEVNDSLWRLQTEVPCYCLYSNDCYRNNVPIQSGVVGAMVVTDQFPPDVHGTAKRIYDDAKLETANCSNGLLIVYATDGPKIYTYRGKLTQNTLSSDDALRIMNKTVVRLGAGPDADRTALQDLIKEYISYLKGPTYERQSSWWWIVGLVVAVVIALLAFAIALGIFFAGCCCKKKKKPWRQQAALMAPPPPPLDPKVAKKLKARVLRALKRRAKNNKPIRPLPPLRTKDGKPLTPSQLAAAQKRLALQAGPSKYPGPGPSGSGGDEPYYVISEPSTMYSTLQRVRSPVENMPVPPEGATGPAGTTRTPGGSSRAGQLGPRRSVLPGPGHYSPHEPPPGGGVGPGHGVGLVPYPDSPSSQAFLIPPSRLSPLPPEKEIQRRDCFVTDEDAKTNDSTMK